MSVGRRFQLFFLACIAAEHLWNACAASMKPVKSKPPANELPAAWLPSRHLASEWLAFVRPKEHPEDSFPDGLDAAHSKFAIH